VLTETPELSLRPASEDDAALLREWRNDPETRAASRNTTEVGIEEHAAWLTAVLADPAHLLLICELGGEPAGQIRFDRLGERSYEISISLAPAARGQGLSPSFISLAVEQLRKSHRDAKVEAHVREKNTSSLAAFRRAGFRPSGKKAEGFLVLVT